MDGNGVYAHEPSGEKRYARGKKNNWHSPVSWPLLVALLLTGVPKSLAGIRGRNTASPSVGIVVRLYNHAQVPVDILQGAERNVAQVVRPAGINISFVDCPITRERGPSYFVCQEAADSPFVVKIITQGVAQHMPASRDAFGLAAACGPGAGPCTAYVFSNRILQLTPGMNVSASVVLGRVLSHEIGHLLGLPHSEVGLMRAEWNPSDFDPGNLYSILFTSSDRQRMHTQAAARFADGNR